MVLSIQQQKAKSTLRYVPLRKTTAYVAAGATVAVFVLGLTPATATPLWAVMSALMLLGCWGMQAERVHPSWVWVTWAIAQVVGLAAVGFLTASCGTVVTVFISACYLLACAWVDRHDLTVAKARSILNLDGGN